MQSFPFTAQMASAERVMSHTRAEPNVCRRVSRRTSGAIEEPAKTRARGDDLSLGRALAATRPQCRKPGGERGPAARGDDTKCHDLSGIFDLA